MKLLVIFLYFFVTIIFGANGAKILGVFQVPTISHQNIAVSLMHGLAAKGHDVTILSAHPAKEKIPNVRDIHLDGIMDVANAARKDWANMPNAGLFTMFSMLNKFCEQLSEATLKSPVLQKLIKEETFDVVVIEPFINEAFYGLGYVFDAHTVVLSTADSSWVNKLAGNVAPYSFVPHGMSSYSDRMTFFERLGNTYSNLMYMLFTKFVFHPTQKNLYLKYFQDAPEFETIIKNTSLFLVNSNIILESPRPYLPNMISIGGIQMKQPKKLPKDLQEFLDGAKEGAIFFSLGSNIHSKDLPLEKREIILKTFSKLPQKILWKFEDENLPGKPDNVKISKWLPQTDILAHPNLKIFITHGGLLSTTEALYRGVPIIGIPFYGDQHGNVEKFVSAGYGQRILFKDITVDSFTDTIKEVLNNPRYQNNMKQVSSIITDHPEKPIDRAVYWVEYVIRHNGAKHLRAASLDLCLGQYLLLDIIAFVAGIASVISYIFYRVCKKICCSKKSKTDAQNGFEKKKKPKRE